MKDWLKHFFTFSPTEQRGILILGLLMMAVGFYKNILPDKAPEPIEITIETSEKLAAFELDVPRFNSKPKGAKRVFKGTDKPFDPNLLSRSEWESMGFSQKEAASIRKFIEKGGRFRKPEDLKKLYCMSPERYVQLEPFIQLGQSERSANNVSAATQKSKQIKTPIELNTADSLKILTLPGIGAYRASAILRQRNRLGGFYSTDQLHEIRSLPDSVVQKLKLACWIDSHQVKRFNINTITFEEVQNHPYFWKGVAKSIVNYRSKHGPFRSAADLSKIYALSEEQRKKVIHYLRFE